MSTVTILLFIFGADSFKDYNEVRNLYVPLYIIAILTSNLSINLGVSLHVPYMHQFLCKNCSQGLVGFYNV